VDAFSYVSGLTSVILALGIARLLVGVGKLLEKRSQVKLYWVHLMWVANIFLFIVLEWWVLFRWQTQSTWSFYLFMFLLASPTVVFLLCVMLFHDPLPASIDFKEHYYHNHRWFFALGALLPILDFFDTFLKGYQHLLDQGPIYIVTLVTISSMSVVAAITKNEKYHRFFSIFFLVYMLIFISINLSTLT
jgi:hypothetical protein